MIPNPTLETIDAVVFAISDKQNITIVRIMQYVGWYAVVAGTRYDGFVTAEKDSSGNFEIDKAVSAVIAEAVRAIPA